MTGSKLIGSWVRRFLLEHVVGERNLSINTQRSYRDMLALFLPFAAKQSKKAIDRLEVVDLSPDLIRSFLTHLEQERACSLSTRNQRLGGLHALARFVGEHSPEHLDWCTQVRLIPFKKTMQAGITYLDKEEMDALLAAPDRRSEQGRRDYALLLFLYNSGARARLRTSPFGISTGMAARCVSQVRVASSAFARCGRRPSSNCVAWQRRARPQRLFFGTAEASQSPDSASTRWWSATR